MHENIAIREIYVLHQSYVLYFLFRGIPFFQIIRYDETVAIFDH